MNEASRIMLSPQQRADWAALQKQLVAEIREHGHAVTGGWIGRQVLILNTTGARTGTSRSAPLAYSIDNGRYIVTASKGGAPDHPAWYHNLVANPAATVEVDRRTIPVRARVAEGAERQRLWDRHIELHPAIGEYPKKTTRVIPIVILDPIG